LKLQLQILRNWTAARPVDSPQALKLDERSKNQMTLASWFPYRGWQSPKARTETRGPPVSWFMPTATST